MPATSTIKDIDGTGAGSGGLNKDGYLLKKTNKKKEEQSPNKKQDNEKDA